MRSKLILISLVILDLGLSQYKVMQASKKSYQSKFDDCILIIRIRSYRTRKWCCFILKVF